MTFPEILKYACVLRSRGFGISFYFYRSDALRAAAAQLPEGSRIYAPRDFFEYPDSQPVDDNEKAPIYNRERSLRFIQIAPYIGRDPTPEIAPGFAGKTVNNIGDFECMRAMTAPAEPSLSLCGDVGLNVYNAASASAYYELSGGILSSVALSPELDADSQFELAKRIRLSNGPRPELIVYGRVPVMRSEHCVVSGLGNILPGEGDVLRAAFDACSPSRNCGRCRKGGTFYLEGEKDLVYPVMPLPDVCGCLILSPSKVDLLERVCSFADAEEVGRPIARFNIFDEVFDL